MQQLQDIVEALEELKEDNTVPRNIKAKIVEIIGILKQPTEVSIRINRALDELDSISEDTNMQAYTRSQMWNIVSMLESVQH